MKGIIHLSAFETILLSIFLSLIAASNGKHRTHSSGPGDSTNGQTEGIGMERRHWRRSTTGSSNDCRQVAAHLESINVSQAIPQRKVSVSDLQICGIPPTLGVTSSSATVGASAITAVTATRRQESCCSRATEIRLHDLAVDNVHDLISSSTAQLKSLLINSIDQYRVDFLNVLRTAGDATKQILQSAHRIPPQELNQFVGILFDNLSTYIHPHRNITGGAGGGGGRGGGGETLNITESVEKFFDSLLPAVIQYDLNDPSTTPLNSSYRHCLASHRRSLPNPPFGLDPLVLAADVARSLRVARALLDAFDVASRTLDASERVAFDASCSRALTRLVHCALCAGHVGVRPCGAFCRNAVRGCLMQIATLDEHWSLFVDAVHGVTSGMKDDHDVQHVMTSFSTRVSDAVRLATMSTIRYHAQMISKCGNLPRNNSKTVSNPTSPPHRPTLRTQGVAGGISSHSSHPPQPAVKLHLKIEMFVRNVVDSKGFFRRLPDELCSSEQLSAGDYDSCWNGTHLGKSLSDCCSYDDQTVQTDWELGLLSCLIYTKSSNTDALLESNPEMKIPDTKPPAIVELTNRLDQMTKTLHGLIAPRQKMQADSVVNADSAYASGDDGEYHRYRGGCKNPHEDDDGCDDGSTPEVDPYSGTGSGTDTTLMTDTTVVDWSGVTTVITHLTPSTDFVFTEASTTTKKTTAKTTTSKEEPRPTPRSSAAAPALITSGRHLIFCSWFALMTSTGLTRYFLST